MVRQQSDKWIVGGWLDIASQPDGSTDRPTDRTDNKQTNRHWSSILPIKRSANKQTNHPVTYKSNHHPSIYPTNWLPTNQPEEVLTSDHCLIFQYGDSTYPHFCLTGCMVVGLPTSISEMYKRTPTSPSDLHLSIWSSSEPPFQSPNY